MKAPGYAFTLQPSHYVRHQAMQHSEGFARYFAKKIAKNLSRALGRQVDFWFSVHPGNGKGRFLPHLHGAINLSPDELPKAREALFRIGRRRASARFKDYIIQLDEIYGAPGWIDYACGDVNDPLRKRIPGGQLVASSAGLKHGAQAAYEAYRRECGASPPFVPN
jgi:hypothetical protein